MTSYLDSAASSRTGRARRVNEDAVRRARVTDAAGRPYALWLVADGVGGGPRGEEASRTAVETVTEYLRRARWTDPGAALTVAYGLAGDRVRALTSSGSAATTLVAALIDEEDGLAWIANVGDSRAYLLSDGWLGLVTEDHSITGEAVAAGRMDRETAQTAPGRNVLTRALGPRQELEVDIFGPRHLAEEERLVLCTDGVYGVIDDPTLIALASLPLPDAADRLVDAVVAARGRDDATVCVGGFRSGPATALAPQARKPTAFVGLLSGCGSVGEVSAGLR